MKVKKVEAMVLTAAMAATLLAGCGSATDTSADATDSTAAESTAETTEDGGTQAEGTVTTKTVHMGTREIET